MNFRVSRASERLVGTVDEGEELVEVLTRVCEDQKITAGQIRAVGHFDAIELVYFDPARQSYEPVVDGEGGFDLVTLYGNVSRLGDEVVLRLEAVFNVAGPAGPQMVAGQLRSARARSAEFVVESFSDLALGRRLDAATGRLILDSVERTAPVSSKPSTVEPAGKGSDEAEAPAMSWDEAIAEAEQVDKKRSRQRGGGSSSPSSAGKIESGGGADPYAGMDLDEPFLEAGDLLEHPKLGRCRVLDIEDEQYCKIRLPRGRIRKLALEVLDVAYRGEEDGRRVFEAQVKR